MHAKPGEHPDEQTLEAYLLGSLSRRKVRRIEEHLLGCPECVEASEKLSDYIRSMRAALDDGKPKLTIAHRAFPAKP
jgi:anti-sigma factor RsiW